MSHSGYHCNFDNRGEGEINIEINALEGMIYPEIFLDLLIPSCNLQLWIKLEKFIGLSEGGKRSPIFGVSYILYD